MRYMKFDENNIQEQMVLAEEKPGNDWYAVPDEIDGKLFKLVSGAPIAMTEEQKDEYYLSLKTNYQILVYLKQKEQSGKPIDRP